MSVAQTRHFTSDETRRKIGKANKQKMKQLWQDPEYRKSQSMSHQGYRPEMGTREKLSAVQKGKKIGKDNPQWKGGIAPNGKSIQLRHEFSFQLTLWREKVLERDNYICRKCGEPDSHHTHHVKSFLHYPELRFEVSNGLTLCLKCHRIADKETNSRWHGHQKKNGQTEVV